MCSMSATFHRKKENFIGCPFRLVYKATDMEEIRSFRLFHTCEFHNHEVTGALDESHLLNKEKRVPINVLKNEAEVI